MSNSLLHGVEIFPYCFLPSSLLFWDCLSSTREKVAVAFLGIAGIFLSKIGSSEVNLALTDDLEKVRAVRAR